MKNKLDVFIENNEVDYTNKLIDRKSLSKIESTYGFILGKKLKKYILTYGYLGYKYVELNGINNVSKEKSDLVKETISINNKFERTKGLLVIENQGDGDYILVDKDDMVYRFLSEINDLQPRNIDLFDYILERFEGVKNEGNINR